MGMFRRLLRFVGVGRRETEGSTSAAPASVPSASYVSLFGAGAGYRAMGIATVYRCVKLLSESVANLPMQYMRLTADGIFVEDTADRLHYLLTIQPDPAMSAFDFWAQTVENLLLDGNAYIVPVRNTLTMEIDRLVLCRRSTVTHDTYNDTYAVNDITNGVSGTFGEADIIHIKGEAPDGKHGLSVLSYARQTLDISSSAEAETLSQFRNGGSVRGIVGNDKSVQGFGEYQDEQLEKAATDIDERFRRGERIVSLPGQVDFKQISLSSADMQFLESRKFTVREICRFFGVHPSFVFDDTSNNYKSAEMANVAFLSNTLNPILRKIENELHRKLIAPALCCKRKFQFDRRALYACDLDSRVKYQLQTIQAGLYTVNEWRREENKLPVEGGDTVLVSANLKSIEALAAGQDGGSTALIGGTDTDTTTDGQDENATPQTGAAAI